MSSILPHLPPEIIIDILSRLPAKPLFRFKCVCTSWLSLISNNPEFAKAHLRHAKQDTGVNRYRLCLPKSPFQSIDHDAYCYGNNVVTRNLTYRHAVTDELDFIGSCNGLIALALDSDSDIIVWNPTTGDSRLLPPGDSSMSDKVFSGFGYDSYLDDYKVVRGVAAASSESGIKMEVFNLKGNTWRSINDLKSNISINGSCISINGFLYWLVHIEHYPNEKLGIISFDLAEEKFVEMVEVPDDLTKKFGSNSLKMHRVGENVCVCTDCYQDCYEGWIMERDGSEISWRKWYSFRKQRMPRCQQWCEVIWVAKNGNVLFDFDGTGLLLHNPEAHRSFQYHINWEGFQTITYLETLVSPNSV
ncbi:F-box/kelch-repeat protein At3g06240-like [Euphorbia lathyris]|uniref:F-box/kelch-repeat protein At3g06240-like n=1 Tax=Euphorbia lathyris TaxID=212925 RepID=UPI0033140DA9